MFTGNDSTLHQQNFQYWSWGRPSENHILVDTEYCFYTIIYTVISMSNPNHEASHEAVSCWAIGKEHE